MLRNYVLVNKQTGKILNALSTPTEGVTLVPESSEQEVWEITYDDFCNIFDGTYCYWNYETQEFEPEDAYKWVLITPGPYLAGLVTLAFEQRTWKEELVVKPILVNVTVNSQSRQVQVDDGTLELELECPEPMTLHIKLEAERHKIFEDEVVIGG